MPQNATAKKRIKALKLAKKTALDEKTAFDKRIRLANEDLSLIFNENQFDDNDMNPKSGRELACFRATLEMYEMNSAATFYWKYDNFVYFNHPKSDENSPLEIKKP